MRIAVGKIEAAKKPFFRALAEARMNVKIAAAHSDSIADRSGSALRDPIAIGGRLACFGQPIQEPGNLSPDVRAVRNPADGVRAGAKAHPTSRRTRRAVPSQARDASPGAAHAVNERACGKGLSLSADRGRSLGAWCIPSRHPLAARSASLPKSQAGAIKPRGFRPAVTQTHPARA